MGAIQATDRDGSRHALQGRERASIMEILRHAGLSVEALCSGCCQCATCHVYVDPAWVEATGSADHLEKDMLECAMDLQDNSRLSCQIEVSDELDGLVVCMPELQI